MSQMKHVVSLAAFFVVLVFLATFVSQQQPATGTPQKAKPAAADVRPTATVATPGVVVTGDRPIFGASRTVVAKDGGPQISLEWKIDEDEVVAYRTGMHPVENSRPAISFNLDELFTEQEISDVVKQQLSAIRLPDSFSMISILERNARDNISVKLIVHEVDLQEAAPDDAIGGQLNELMGGMEGTVQLRGEVTPEGAIASFYLEEKQRNLLAMMFELPTEKVSAGDTWEIDVNCIDLSNGFIVESAERVNRVKFAEITENAAGDPIAVLHYVIVEAVDGAFQMPFSDDVVPVSMTCSYFGRGLFLIEEGRWERFTGEFALNSTGLMNADSVQRFALTPLEDVPEAYLGLE